MRLEIVEEEATVVRRIFETYARGGSLATISKQLNAEGILAPQPPRTRQIRAWGPSSIREMIRNERYRGVFVWNRTKKERNPETGRKTSRPRPQADWMRVEVPEWRIVSEELWRGVEAQIELVNKRFGKRSVGGFGRMGHGPRYLFSGFIYCGLCDSKMIIVSGNGRRGYVTYGCPSHRYRGVCENAMMIRRDRLEEQLLTGLGETRSESGDDQLRFRPFSNTPGTLTKRETFYYNLSLPISTAIIGCDSVEQVEECVELARSFTPLSQAQMAALEAKVEPVAKQALFFRLMPR